MFVNASAREINLRIVCFGLDGLASSRFLHALRDGIPEPARGQLVSAASGEERTEFFDFVPPGLALVRDHRLRLHLYALVGEVTKSAVTRILRGVDGVVLLGSSPELERWATEGLALYDRSWSELPFVRVSPAEESGTEFEALKAMTKELLLALREGRLLEPAPTPGESREAGEFVCRARLIGHYGEHFGETTAEYAPPAGLSGLPQIFVASHAPGPQRPYWTYATAGLSLLPQAAGGPEPRLELLAYSEMEDPRVADVLTELAYQIAGADAEGPPYKTFDTVDLSGTGIFHPTFVLAPALESEALLLFPTEDPVNFLFRSFVGAAPLSFVHVVPVTKLELQEANEQGTRSVLAAHRAAGRVKFAGWPQ